MVNDALQTQAQKTDLAERRVMQCGALLAQLEIQIEEAAQPWNSEVEKRFERVEQLIANNNSHKTETRQTLDLLCT